MLSKVFREFLFKNRAQAQNKLSACEGLFPGGNVVKPEFGCLGITDECMLRCKMCYKWQPDIFISEKDVNSYPSVDQYRKFLNELRELVDKEFVLNFGGGEALLFEHIYEVIKIGSEYGFRTNLNSNGFLIDEQVARRLADAGLENIKLSLDSVDSKIHDHMRGVKGVHERVLKAIDNLHKFAPKIRVALISVIYEQTYRDFIPLIEWINNNEKIEHVLVMVAMQPNNTPEEKNWWNGKYEFLWPKDKKAVGRLIDELIEMKNKRYKINNSAAQLKAVKKYLEYPEKFVKKTTCNMDKAVHVSSIGQLFLCFNYGILGDIRNGDDLRKIWVSDKAQQVREKIKRCKKNCHFLINCFFEEDKIPSNLQNL
ncbi:MAG: radical SAM protein [Candidatus Omnitrophica bacterium]|nr:radical SAM protein [Candidatus Omnitrophota bacterium]MBU4477877.1 radical SAM protein [Candidatus Omnitrophota bacterium]MCG2704151.1 radical SAM protein [Candidatus Omnitrophota bacterium]